MNETHTINIVDMYLASIDWDDQGNPILVVEGLRTSEQRYRIRIRLGTWGAEHIAEKIHEVAQRMASRLESLRKALRGT